MPRPPRIDFPGFAQHLIVRGVNRNRIFFSEQDRSYFLKCLGEARSDRGCDIHAFVLMPNHVHLLATGHAPGAISRMMQDLGRAYVSHVNKLHKRTGALYEGRFKSSVVETTDYLLNCMRYIEMNPVRARLADRPGSFEWSSYGQNVTGEPAGLIRPHQQYLLFGNDRSERAFAYRAFVDSPIPAGEIEQIRKSINQGKALASRLFCDGLKALLGRPVTCVARGRPRTRPIDLSPFS